MKELKGLRIKFVVSNMVMVTLVIGLAFLAVGFFTKAMVARDNEQMLGRAVQEGGQAFLPEAGGTRLPYFILITDRNSQVVQVEGQYGLEPDQELLGILAAQSLAETGSRGFLEHYQLRYLKQPLENGYRIAYVDTSLERAFAFHMWKTLGVIGLFVWLALLAISCVLSKWAVAPVGRSIHREKQFVADASHELKTPLTVIMANAQLLEEQQTKDQDLQRWTGNILQEAREMKRLVEEMLTLARSESGDTSRFHRFCSLSDVVIESVLSFEAVFYQESKELSSSVEEGIQIWGEESSLRQLVGILLDNAVKYSSPGGRTRVCLERTGAFRARLTVADTGDPIPEDKLEELFERFYRSDVSRGDQKGYGLGLAIARSIAQKHRGKISAQSKDGENRFWVDFRLREPFGARWTGKKTEQA